MYYLNKTTSRAEAFKYFTFFSDYIYHEKPNQSGRHKYLLRTYSDGEFNVHWSHYCVVGKAFYPPYLQILHYRIPFEKSHDLIDDQSLSSFTPIVQQKANKLFGYSF